MGQGDKVSHTCNPPTLTCMDYICQCSTAYTVWPHRVQLGVAATTDSSIPCADSTTHLTLHLTVELDARGTKSWLTSTGHKQIWNHHPWPIYTAVITHYHLYTAVITHWPLFTHIYHHPLTSIYTYLSSSTDQYLHTSIIIRWPVFTHIYHHPLTSIYTHLSSSTDQYLHTSIIIHWPVFTHIYRHPLTSIYTSSSTDHYLHYVHIYHLLTIIYTSIVIHWPLFTHLPSSIDQNLQTCIIIHWPLFTNSYSDLMTIIYTHYSRTAITTMLIIIIKSFQSMNC